MKSRSLQAVRWLLDKIAAPYIPPFRRYERVDPGTQRLLYWKYRDLARGGGAPPSFDEVGFRAYSQTNEDGILLYLFALLGTTDRRVVELCVEEGIECNAANLIVNHGWVGLLFDGSERNIAAARRFYARCRDTWIKPPDLVSAWITAENVNTLLQTHGFTGEVDLLSIDIDGMDYWIWKAIECLRPRVIVVEYSNGFDPGQAVVCPYDADFGRAGKPLGQAGASLAALVALGRAKGYRLVGCNQFAFNAFFVRAGLAPDLLPEVSAAACAEVSHRRYGRPPGPVPRPPGWVEV